MVLKHIQKKHEKNFDLGFICPIIGDTLIMQFTYLIKKKKITNKFILIMILFHVNTVNAQVNMVPNWSFELYDSCPSSADQINFCSGWSKYSSNVTSPDYYNACAPETSFGVPNNIVSFQPDHRNCIAYAGIVTRGGSFNDREYIGIQLNQPLMVGEKYFMVIIYYFNHSFISI